MFETSFVQSWVFLCSAQAITAIPSGFPSQVVVEHGSCAELFADFAYTVQSISMSFIEIAGGGQEVSSSANG